MHDVLLTVLAELRGSWRFRWHAVAVAWLVCVIGWIVVFALPDNFESRATIYVDTSSALKPLLKTLTVDTDVLSRVELVTTAMLGRPQLEKVARTTDLHLRAKNQQEMDRLVAGMYNRISIGTPNRRDPSLYVISYRDPEPDMAQSVVSTLLNTFVEDSLGVNRLDTQRAQDFLRGELTSLEEELSGSERKLAEFKRANVGRMPGEGGGYFSRLQSEMSALDQTQSELRLAQRRQAALRGQLSGERPVTETQSSATNDLDQRIALNENRLEELQLRFTDLHPDVISVKRTLEQLREQKVEALAELTQNTDSITVSDNPVFQNIQIEMSNVQVAIQELLEKEANHRRKIAELRELIDVLPEVEAELARLSRDYDVKQSQYQSLLKSLEVAELSESAEQSEDVKFRIIDPPIYPDAPVAPNRLLLIAAVLLGGLGVAGATAFLGNQLRPVFSDVRTLRKTTGFPVLGTVTALRTADRRNRRIKEISSFSIAIGTLLALFVVTLLLREPATDLVQSLI